MPRLGAGLSKAIGFWGPGRVFSLHLAAVILLVSAVPFGWADTRRVTDDRDTGDIMDLAEASHGHTESVPRRFIHEIESWEAWTNDDFAGADLVIWLEDRDSKWDRLVTVHKNPDLSLVTQVRGGSGSFLGYANAWRPDDKTLRIELPKRFLGWKIDRYTWKAFLSYPCSRDPNVICEPLPPDTHKGRVTHRL